MTRHLGDRLSAAGISTAEIREAVIDMEAAFAFLAEESGDGS